MTDADTSTLKTFHFRHLDPLLFLGTGSDPYVGWRGQIYSKERCIGRITRRRKWLEKELSGEVSMIPFAISWIPGSTASFFEQEYQRKDDRISSAGLCPCPEWVFRLPAAGRSLARGNAPHIAWELARQFLEG